MKKIQLDLEKVISLYNELKNCRKVAEVLGCSKHPIQTLLRERGILAKKEKNTPEKKLKPVFSDLEIVDYYRSHTLKETLAHFKIGQAKVLEACKRLNFQKPKYTWKDWDDSLKKKAREKAVATCQRKYGKGSLSNPEKISQTRLDPQWFEDHKDYYIDIWSKAKITKNSPEYKDKMAETFKKIGEKTSRTLLSRTPEEIEHFRESYRKTCQAKYGVENTWALAKQVHHSSGEKEVKNFLISLGFNPCSSKKIISPYEIDLYIKEKNFAIEYNGTFWHSSENKDKLYHYHKTLACEKAGIRLFHIYEWEWRNPIKQEIIKSVLSILLGKTPHRIYARQCTVAEVDQKIYREFCEENHLQGYRKAKLVYGLYKDGKLWQLMSFDQPQKRGGKIEYQWEIVRGCPGSNNVVVGGVSKLWKHFLKEQNPDSVMSYCDANKFDGKSYGEIGMQQVSFQKPNIWYIDRKTGKVTQWLYRNKEKRDYQLQNSLQVYGVGNKVFVWRKL